MRTLQIGMTAAARNSGGVDRYFFDLLRAFAARGEAAHGLVVGAAADVAAHGIAGVEAYAPDGVSLLARWKALRGAVTRQLPRTDLVVSHFAPYAFPVLDRIRSHPTVIHFHGSWARESQAEGARALTFAAKLALERLVYRGGARFIVLTNSVAQALQRDFHVPPELIRIVPGGVDTARFGIIESRAEARAALGLPADRPIVLTTRRLVPSKGIEPLIEAVALVRRQIREILLLIAGTGPLAETLQRRVRELGLDDNVRFLGFVDDPELPRTYRAADLFVVPTVAMEGFGLVVIESLACGTPAIVTPVAGLPETVRDFDPSLIMRGSAPHDLADAIVDRLDGTLPLHDRQACRTYAERFDWRHIAGQIRSVYAEVA
jgi:glycosyltransferase involved in cell wall biosynthesis